MWALERGVRAQICCAGVAPRGYSQMNFDMTVVTCILSGPMKTCQIGSGMNRRARRELRIQNDEGAVGGREITRSGACLPRWYVSQP